MFLKDTILIGIGNDFRSDDGVGLHIARRLRESGISGITILENTRDAMDLLEQWKGYRTAVLFDAVSSGKDPGTVHRFEIPPQEVPRSTFLCSTHAWNLADTIELARSLQQVPEKIVIFGIEGKIFEMGRELSREVQSAAEKIVKRVKERDI